MTEDLIHTRWRHLKRGTTYEVVGIAKLQTARTEEGLADETPMVVYKNEASGALSVRSVGEFGDGRFEKISRVPSARERALERVALDFIHKVDRGEVQSVRTYAALKAALET